MKAFPVSSLMLHAAVLAVFVHICTGLVSPPPDRLLCRAVPCLGNRGDGPRYHSNNQCAASIGCINARRLSAFHTSKIRERMVADMSPLDQASTLDLSLLSNAEIATAFSGITFLPQSFWLLMILLPNAKITKQIMGSWLSILLPSLLHLFIVVVSATQQDGTAPIAEFANVFDPTGNPQQAMVHMMQYPNFVAEEWAHVLTWDFFVGRWIWLDGINRGLFTAHSVLLTNLIGPPGFLLHALTCLITGKGLPPVTLPSPNDKDRTSTSTATTTTAAAQVKANPAATVQNLDNSKQIMPKIAAAGAGLGANGFPFFGLSGIKQPSSQQLSTNTVFDAGKLVSNLFGEVLYREKWVSNVEVIREGEREGARESGAAVLAAACAEEVLWEDTALPTPLRGRDAVRAHLEKRVSSAAQGTRFVLDRVADGKGEKASVVGCATGFTWHFEVAGVDGWGLRGITYVRFNSGGKIVYVREVNEPLYKLGGLAGVLLKGVAEKNLKDAAAAAAADDFSKNGASKARIVPEKMDFIPRVPVNAEDMVRYLWQEVPQERGEEGLAAEDYIDNVIRKTFADSIVYEDLNFDEPYRGLEEVVGFVREFSIPGISFVVEEVSEGETAVCFTWRVEIFGVEASTPGISFYALQRDTDGVPKVTYVRDVPAPAIKPPPLLNLASKLRPGLRRFRALPVPNPNEM